MAVFRQLPSLAQGQNPGLEINPGRQHRDAEPEQAPRPCHPLEGQGTVFGMGDRHGKPFRKPDEQDDIAAIAMNCGLLPPDPYDLKLNNQPVPQISHHVSRKPEQSKSSFDIVSMSVFPCLYLSDCNLSHRSVPKAQPQAAPNPASASNSRSGKSCRLSRLNATRNASVVTKV